MPNTELTPEIPAIESAIIAPPPLVLSAVQELEVEQARSETTRLRVERLKAESDSVDLARSTAALVAAHKRERAIRTAIDSIGAKFHSEKEVLQLLESDGNAIKIDADGNATVEYQGENLSLEEGLRRFTADNRFMADGRSIKNLTDSRPLSKASFKSVAEKTRFIETRGIEAFEALPLVTSQAGHPQTRESYDKLDFREKSRLVGIDANFRNKLPKEATGQPRGGYINFEALAREKATRAGSR